MRMMVLYIYNLYDERFVITFSTQNMYICAMIYHSTNKLSLHAYISKKTSQRLYIYIYIIICEFAILIIMNTFLCFYAVFQAELIVGFKFQN